MNDAFAGDSCTQTEGSNNEEPVQLHPMSIAARAKQFQKLFKNKAFLVW